MPSPKKQSQNTIKAVSPTVKYKRYSTNADPRLGKKVSLPEKLVKPALMSSTRDWEGLYLLVEDSQSARGGASESANAD